MARLVNSDTDIGTKYAGSWRSEYLFHITIFIGFALDSFSALTHCD